MKKKNIEKVLCLLFDMNRLDLNGVSIKGLRDILLEHLSNKQPESNNEDDEMEEFKWENCIEGKGYYVNDTSRILDIDEIWGHNGNEAVANSESIIESNISACKLSWIITKINKKYPIVYRDGFCLVFVEDAINYHNASKSSLPRLNNVEVFNTLVMTNTPLIKQYFGIKE